MSSNALCESLPYWEFESGSNPHLLLWDGSLSSGIEIVPKDIGCLDAPAINQITLNLRTLVNSLPEKMTAQVCVKVEAEFGDVLERHSNLRITDNEFLMTLDDDRISELSGQVQREEVYRPRVFFFLKTESPEKPSALALKKTQKFAVTYGNDMSSAIQSLMQALQNAQSILGSAGFQSKVLSREQLISLAYKHLNPKRSREVDAPTIAARPESLESESPRNQLIFGDLILNQEDFVLDRTLTRVLTLKTLPESTFAGMMSLFANVAFKYEMIFSFHIPDQASEIKGLEQKRRMAHSLTTNNHGRVSDLEGESRLAQTTDLIREIIDTGQRVFVGELLLILREENTAQGNKRINLRSKEILSCFRKLSGAEGIQETVGAWKIFSNELIGSPMALVRGKKMKSNNLADFLPLYGSDAGDDRPLVLTHTRSGSLYALDSYDSKLNNYNSLVTGSSGAGKSFTNNFFMLQQIARGVKLFVIDVGGSYKKLTNIMKGQYFEINLTAEYALNPFQLQNPGEKVSSERIKALVNIIEQMIVDEGEKLLRFDRVLIEEALAAVFEDIRTKTPQRSPQISDFARHCEKSKEETLKRIGKLLYPWIGNSAYGKLIDRQGKINADSPVVAFDLKGLAQYPDLQSVVTLILTGFILDQVELNKGVPKRVLLDEAWSFLQSKAASTFMEYAARALRKTGSGITFITQGVEEIVESAIGSAILNNTATKMILQQQGDTKILKEALRLKSQEVRLIESLDRRKGAFSDVFVMNGDSRQVLRIQPSPVEYWISTSDASDNCYLQGIIDSGVSLEGAILKAAKEAPFGVDSSATKVAA
ncbi:ATP-binding protein [Bdellovibrio sp. SKB1291214]|uniref:TraG/VirB4 family ATPase n=1 Tax=Bdellovibrio sp. SKB1291214 TaxID=1732569 RepID=UPI000B51C43C|nr:TraC family protein [Bdellovibrio sp. SKB1291214]UYL09874.1 ATP-binding protein [Bdellovibrio sp. SKB1291214]